MEVRGEEPLLLFHLWKAGPEFDFEPETPEHTESC
jgi:hypothetical protein